MSSRTEHDPATIEAPPRPVTARGETRRLGVEIEYGKLDIDRAAREVARLFGGRILCRDPYCYEVKATRLGDFRIELDSQYVLPDEEKEQRQPEGAELRRQVRRAVGWAVHNLVPYEVTCPPIPYTALDEIDRLVDAMRHAGAAGTESSPAYAYGLQLNPELPDLETPTVVAHLKAYLLLSDWLRQQIDVDLLRRVLSFADPFPTDYMRRVAHPDYAPSQAGMIDDYLRYNATRNRELDMLPLFAALDEGRVQAAVDDIRIKPRPTFHYRLPNSQVDEARWSVSAEWERWLTVERLAYDAARLDALCARYQDKGLAADGREWLAGGPR